MKIKICGLTKVTEADYINQYQVDYVGMVLFFEKSRRNITIAQAKLIMQALDAKIQKVAVVVSPAIDQIREIEAAGFDFIQIHGIFPKETISIPVLKAFYINDLQEQQVYSACSHVAGYVLDAKEPGSGKTFDWTLVQKFPRDEKLLFLAGGLTPENVREAIVRVSPDGVDVSSGVEYANGGKDPDKIRRFVEAVRSC